jgi:hypothetical protein
MILFCNSVLKLKFPSFNHCIHCFYFPLWKVYPKVVTVMASMFEDLSLQCCCIQFPLLLKCNYFFMDWLDKINERHFMWLACKQYCYAYLQYLQPLEYVSVLFADRTLDHEVWSVCWYTNHIVAFWYFTIICTSYTSKSHNSLVHVLEHRPIVSARNTYTIKLILWLQRSLSLCSRSLSEYLSIVFSNHLSMVDILNGTNYNWGSLEIPVEWNVPHLCMNMFNVYWTDYSLPRGPVYF